jgi:hypothetical protein
VLKERLGYPHMNKYTLSKIRERYGLRLRKYRSPQERAEAHQEAREFILSELENGQSIRYGHARTYRWTRQNVRRYLTREDVRNIVRELDPDAVRARDRREDRRRRRFTVKGPNRYWSADGHDKLAYFGFQIYGIIDAYSRMIIGVFVGVSNRTQIAVLAFFLHCIRLHNCFPKKLRTDKGSETLLMASAQVKLRRQEKGEDLPFAKAYTFGPSTKNQRIEAWWNTLASGQTESWKRFFESLHEADLFDGESKYDLMAIRFVYMEHLRKHIQNFVTLHNIATIRPQRLRADYLRDGVPEELYYCHWDVRDYGTVPTGATEELLAQFEDDLKPYDFTVYQTPQVKELCEELLEVAGLTYSFEKFKPGLDQPHVTAYRYLRRALREYEEVTGIVLENIEPPRGGEQWFAGMQEAEEELERAIRENRGPGSIRDEDLVSEIDMMDEGDTDSQEGSDNEGILDDLLDFNDF